MIPLTRRLFHFVLILLALAVSACATKQGVAAAPTAPATPAAGAAARTIPRTADGKPNFQGIWQVRNRAAYGLEYHPSSLGILPGKSVLVGDTTIPYTPAALKKRNENFEKRAELDPFNQCYMPGVPRIMYIEHPFQIFQTGNHVAMTFEWSQVYRLFYADGSKHQDGIEFWMGDNRAHWEGDTLVNEVTNFNDQTWLDAAGDFHSEQLKVVERFTMVDADTIQYDVRFEDPKVYARPWSISMPFYRHKDMDRLLEFQCQAEKEEANGEFERDDKTWYPKAKP